MSILSKEKLQKIKDALAVKQDLSNLILVEGKDAKTVKDLVETVEFLLSGINKVIDVLGVVNCGGNAKVAKNDLQALLKKINEMEGAKDGTEDFGHCKGDESESHLG